MRRRSTPGASRNPAPDGLFLYPRLHRNVGPSAKDELVGATGFEPATFASRTRSGPFRGAPDAKVGTEPNPLWSRSQLVAVGCTRLRAMNARSRSKRSNSTFLVDPQVDIRGSPPRMRREGASPRSASCSLGLGPGWRSSSTRWVSGSSPSARARRSFSQPATPPSFRRGSNSATLRWSRQW